MAIPKPYPPIVLGFFARGLWTNRQPLFSALTNVGLEIVQFKDYLIDGINIECTDRFTLQRAPGFTKFCPTQLAVSEKVNQFYSTRDLSGNIYPLADTNQRLIAFDTFGLTSILTKGTTAQGFIQQIGEVTYYSNGVDLKKWFPPSTSMVPWGIAASLEAPVIRPGLSTVYNSFWLANHVFASAAGVLDSNGNIELNYNIGPSGNVFPTWSTVFNGNIIDGSAAWRNSGPMGSWSPSTDYALGAVVLDSNNNIQFVTGAGTSDTTVPTWNTGLYGNTTDNAVTWQNAGVGVIIAFSGFNYVFCFRTVSGNLSTASPSVSTGPILSSQPIAPLAITDWSITSNIVTFSVDNNLAEGSQVVLSGFPTSTFFNGQMVTVLAGPSSTQFTATFVRSDSSGTEDGLASPVIASLEGVSSSDPECNSVATITSVKVVGVIVTITAANNYSPGINVKINSLTGASFLNGVVVSVSSATPTTFTANLPGHANYGPTSDSGTAEFLAVEIYRTKDGGGVYYFDGATLNIPAAEFVFYDTAADSQLATELVAPLDHLNDPPPGQVGSTQAKGGTLIAWWSDRLWMAVGNLLYFSGGPDILNGIPEECWPPGNVFVFPGGIASLNATTGGLVVNIPDEMWAIIGGPQTFAYYPERVLTRFGALSPNCVAQDGDTLYVYNSQKQLIVLSGAGKQELGASGSGVGPVGDLLASGTTSSIVTASAWSPTASYITVHRQGEDSGIYLSNGVESIIRYGANVGNFSPIRQPLVTGSASAGALNSVETSSGQFSLLFNPATTHDYIYKRDLTAFTDNGNAYASSAVVGNIVVAVPGQPLAPLQFISAYLYNRGSIPTVSFFPNDISPSIFVELPVVQDDSPFLEPPVSLMAKRWPVLMNQNATPLRLRHLQILMDFGNTDTVKNELIQLGLRFETDQFI